MRTLLFSPLLQVETRALALCASLACVLWGCAGQETADLLVLEKVASSVVQPGEPLRIDGVDLPVGERGSAEVTGTLYRTGQDPLVAHWVLPARVVAPDHARIDGLDALFSELGTSGSFQGDIVLNFDAHDADLKVFGRLESASFDLRNREGDRLALELALARHAETLLRAWGMSVVPDDSGASGLVLTEVTEGSEAALSGLATGDRIELANGLRPQSVADLVPPPTASSVTLSVRGEEALVPRELTLPVHPRVSTSAPAAHVPWWVGLLLIPFVLLSPLASAVDATTSMIRGWRVPVKWWRSGALLLVVLALALATAHARQPLVPVALAVALALPLLLGARRYMDSAESPPEPAHRILPRWATVMIVWVGPVLLLSLAAWFDLESGAVEQRAMQGPWPFQWHASTRPVLLGASVGLFVVGALAVAATRAGRATVDSLGMVPANRLGRWIDALAQMPLLLMSLGLSYALLGGCTVPAEFVPSAWLGDLSTANAVDWASGFVSGAPGQAVPFYVFGESTEVVSLEHLPIGVASLLAVAVLAGKVVLVRAFMRALSRHVPLRASVLLSVWLYASLLFGLSAFRLWHGGSTGGLTYGTAFTVMLGGLVLVAALRAVRGAPRFAARLV